MSIKLFIIVAVDKDIFSYWKETAWLGIMVLGYYSKSRWIIKAADSPNSYRR